MIDRPSLEVPGGRHETKVAFLSILLPFVASAQEPADPILTGGKVVTVEGVTPDRVERETQPRLAGRGKRGGLHGWRNAANAAMSFS
ncbi:MAG: hypothetical protein WD342_04420 [Verrucomicrobiales bacterium]